MLRDEVGTDPAAGGEHDGALDHILELAHVARPVVGHQHVERLGHELESGLAILLAVLLDEVLHEQRDVVFPVPQGRQLHVDDVQPIEQIFAEAPLVHQLA